MLRFPIDPFGWIAKQGIIIAVRQSYVQVATFVNDSCVDAQNMLLCILN